GQAPGGREPVHVLVVLEHADEERRGTGGKRKRRPEERPEVYERGKDRGGLPSQLAHETCRVVGHRAKRIRAAHRGGGDPVGDRSSAVPITRSSKCSSSAANFCRRLSSSGKR